MRVVICTFLLLMCSSTFAFNFSSIKQSKKQEIFGNFIKLASPSFVPNSLTNSIASSHDGGIVAIGLSVSPWLIIMKREGDTFTRMTLPSTMPTANVSGVTVSSDGSKVVAVTSATSGNKGFAYTVSGEVVSHYFTFTDIASAARVVKFSRDDEALLVGVSQSPFILWYDVTESGFNRQASKISVTPAGGVSGRTHGLDISKDKMYIAAATGDEGRLNAHSLMTNIANVYTYSYSIGPAGGLGRSAKFSSDDKYLAMSYNASPFASVYKKNTSGTYVLMPALPSPPTTISPSSVFSHDDKYLIVATSAAPFLHFYEKDGDTFTRVTSNLPVMPTATQQGMAFSGDGRYFFTVGMVGSAINIYKRSETL